MNESADCHVVLFFLNGELENVNVYENEEDAEKDATSWHYTGNGDEGASMHDKASPFYLDVWQTRLLRAPYWRDLRTRCDTLEDTIIQWLHEDPSNVWSNVIASITSSSLAEVYGALLRAETKRQIIIVEKVETNLGPICLVRLPWVDNRIIWMLSDTLDAVWSDEIASATGDALSDVHAGIERLQKIDVVDVLETRQTVSGPLLRVRLHPAERIRQMNLE